MAHRSAFHDDDIPDKGRLEHAWIQTGPRPRSAVSRRHSIGRRGVRGQEASDLNAMLHEEFAH